MTIAVRQITTRSVVSSAATTHSVAASTYAASRVAGDLILLGVVSNSTVSTLPGFTFLGYDSDSSGDAYELWGRVATATSADDVAITFAASTTSVVRGLVMSGTFGSTWVGGLTTSNGGGASSAVMSTPSSIGSVPSGAWTLCFSASNIGTTAGSLTGTNWSLQTRTSGTFVEMLATNSVDTGTVNGPTYTAGSGSVNGRIGLLFWIAESLGAAPRAPLILLL